MSPFFRKERRRYGRYKVQFAVRFQLMQSVQERASITKIEQKEFLDNRVVYLGTTKDVSVDGLGFSSGHEFQKGDLLYIEMNDSQKNETTRMEAEVRWCRQAPLPQPQGPQYFTGVQLMTVNDEPVMRTIYFDKHQQISWNVFLDKMLGGIKRFLSKNRPA